MLQPDDAPEKLLRLVLIHGFRQQLDRDGDIHQVAAGRCHLVAPGFQLALERLGIFRVQLQCQPEIAVGVEQAALLRQLVSRFAAALLVGQHEILVDRVELFIGQDIRQLRI